MLQSGARGQNLDTPTGGIRASQSTFSSCLSIRLRSFVLLFVEFASKFCVKVSQMMYISATTYQKAFIFGP